MNAEKIGKFIRELREKNDWTQQNLADNIPISRQAVSKWERGLAIPDSQVLLKLSDIFNVSVNEILSGQRINENNAEEIKNFSLRIFDISRKKTFIIKTLIGVIILTVFLILSFYFINSYKKIKVYTVSGEGDKIVVSDGIFVNTTEKSFFGIGDFLIVEDQKIISTRLFYINSQGNQINIVLNTKDNIKIVDYYGYDEYFNKNEIEIIKENLYLEVVFDDGIETIKLKLTEDYVNDSIFVRKEKSVGTKEKKENITNFSNEILFEKLKENYKKSDDGYLYVKNNESIIYDDTSKILRLVIMENDKIKERWIFQVEKNILEYHNYETQMNFIYENNKYKCMSKECDSYEIITEKFREKLLLSIK